jgi:uncharacterized protein (TIGR02569 family)
MPGPDHDVLRAFAVPWVEPRLLAGGQGRTWRVADVVLKPVDNDEEHAWVSDVLAGLRDSASVRVPRPLRSIEGGWSWAGWCAHEYVVGRSLTMAGDASAIRSASEAFHTAVAHVPRPAFLDTRDDAWAFGDRVAWDGGPVVGSEQTRALVKAALAAYADVQATPQVVHGDLAGNVLGASGLAPAVIDWPPYWRPVGWALAVAAVDGVAWQEAPPQLFDEWSDVGEWRQLLLRAFVYRVATVGFREAQAQPVMDPSAHAVAMRPVLDRVLAR